VKNTGDGPSRSGQVILRNATGDGVILDKSRFEITDLKPGQQQDYSFPLATDATLKGNEMIVELMTYDVNLDVETRQKLNFKVMPSVNGTPARGDVTAKSAVQIHSGASEDTDSIGETVKGASYAAIATFGPYTKLRLDKTRFGFVPTSTLTNGAGGGNSYKLTWNSTPPTIALAAKNLETSAETYRIQGSVNDETHVEDVYIYVSNPRAKIDSRKVFYRSNRGGKDQKVLDFATDLPLWPGSNLITVVARSNSDVKSVKSMYVYRDPPRTAQKP